MKLTNDQIIYDYIQSLYGLPYRWGGDSTIGGFDCSGLVMELLSVSHGTLPDMTAQGIHDYFNNHRGIQTVIPMFGTLCFYGRSTKEIIHIGYALNRDIMVEAGGGGSRTHTEADAEKDNAYIRTRKILERNDFLCSITPK